mmetsp:Transcript_10798/g.24876  ORF Transcript_10798/g.24876 Transcript_10798/m.24876 type:complete len:128 (-) Transcript_10798:565-948(-)
MWRIAPRARRRGGVLCSFKGQGGPCSWGVVWAPKESCREGVPPTAAWPKVNYSDNSAAAPPHLSELTSELTGGTHLRSPWKVRVKSQRWSCVLYDARLLPHLMGIARVLLQRGLCGMAHIGLQIAHQ